MLIVNLVISIAQMRYFTTFRYIIEKHVFYSKNLL